VNWFLVTLISASILGAISIIDKKCHQYCKNAGTYILFCGSQQALFGILSMAIAGFSNKRPEMYYLSVFDHVLLSFNIPVTPLIFAILSGIVMGSAVLLLQNILFTHEVTRTLPIAQSYPIFSSILAVVFLNEIMTSTQWLCVLLTVTGCMAVNIKFDKISEFSPTILFKDKVFYILMISSFLFGLAFLFGKLSFSYVGLSVLFVHGVRAFFGGGMLVLGTMGNSNAKSELFTLIKHPMTNNLIFLSSLNNFVIAQIGFFLMTLGISLGPVSLVGALSSTRILFTVIFTILLSFVVKGFIDERNTKSDIFVKIVSALMIMGGVSGISIF